MTTKEKILKYIDYKGISKRDFYRQTGLSNGFLDSGKHIGSDNIKIIISAYPEINIEWLVMDNGEMLKPNVKKTPHFESVEKSVGKSVENQMYKKGNTSDPLPPEGSGTEVAALREVIEAQRQQISGLTQDKERLIIDIQEVKEEKNELKAEVKELRHQLELATREITYLKNVSSMGDTQAQVG